MKTLCLDIQDKIKRHRCCYKQVNKFLQFLSATQRHDHVEAEILHGTCRSFTPLGTPPLQGVPSPWGSKEFVMICYVHSILLKAYYFGLEYFGCGWYFVKPGFACILYIWHPLFDYWFIYPVLWALWQMQQNSYTGDNAGPTETIFSWRLVLRLPTIQSQTSSVN